MLHTVCKVTHCTGRISANTRPHQLHWDDREMGTVYHIQIYHFHQIIQTVRLNSTLERDQEMGNTIHAQNIGLFRRLENMT